mmetsp:Transcript_40135/g.61307  ORF Transcript_40135/g.61307 Transcript_40135/m.61307 type:complete len:82 (+) Transcript_40135:286-531(+)
MLDLHDNHIPGIVDFKQLGFSNLQNLRILNMSGNQLEEVHINCPMKALSELNLRGNKLKEFTISSELEALTKLYLSNNQLK